MADNWYVYLLRCHDNTLYCGITKDVKKRLMAHNKGAASRYTRSRLPVKLAAVSGAMSKSGALRFEIKVKKVSKGMKIEMVKKGKDYK